MANLPVTVYVSDIIAITGYREQNVVPGSSRLSYLELITTWSLPRDTICQQVNLQLMQALSFYRRMSSLSPNE